ncbi:M20/M25/M40 family metallo-hydrolase [Gulosibacter sp. ACHW.36C]|uniref:M20/M25/M40 family metallo-hydrolase n=1 Tax=Gulosibacter sp. ACHW.36C TaxID=3434457 RepID=UPI0032D571BF
MSSLGEVIVQLAGIAPTEATGLDYASVNEGVMHACGHDVHVACGLGAARLLAASTGQWSGTYIALFQPAEEIGAGARSMVEAGLTDAVPQPTLRTGTEAAVTAAFAYLG